MRPFFTVFRLAFMATLLVSLFGCKGNTVIKPSPEPIDKIPPGRSVFSFDVYLRSYLHVDSGFLQSIREKYHNVPDENTLMENVNFLDKHALPGKGKLIEYYIKKYNRKCSILTYGLAALKEFKTIGVVDINGDHKADTVFVLPPFNACDNGDSYYFYDRRLPRLLTDSECAHPENMFVASDIDEDGIREIGIFYSSCASRFKSIRLFSLKRGKWAQIASSEFDVLTRDPTEVKYADLVKKIGTKRFKMRNFYEDKEYWQKHTMK